MKSKTILIAYPDDIGNRLLATFFHDLGYRVETARIVSEILRKVRKGTIRVVLLDDQIEGVRACDLVPLLKKNPKVQVIVISSEESLGSAKRLRGAGVFYHAMKPFDLEEIRSAVECAFEKIERESLNDEGLSFWMPNWVPA
ncbi:MAG TPA: response regulator [Thermodesulfobacteriota bacterium]|nr:response regulator [Thermodesulfobacteriota bacterium]